MAVAVGMKREGQKIQGVQSGPFQAVGEAMEVIPRTLAQNCGVSVIRTITQLRAKHASAYEEYEKEALQFVSMRTKIEPGELADAVFFLATDSARHITGTLFEVTGGLEFEP